jgi:hypothetical protein
MKSVFKLVHPVLVVSLGLFIVAAIFLRGQGGPCAFPLILLFAPIELGILVGFILSVARAIKYFIRKTKADQQSEQC